MADQNVPRPVEYSQVCVWRGTVLDEGEDRIAQFENFFMTELNTRVKFLEEIVTGPDLDVRTGEPVPETGGRNDIFFCVHQEDIGHFAIPRLQFKISWIEDVLADGNYNSPIYPVRVFDYCTWNQENLSPLRKLKG